MLWFTVWTVLVVGTLVGAFFLLRKVYRSGRALVSELGRASDVMADVAERAERLGAAADHAGAPAPVNLTDPGPARTRRAESAQATARRRAARAARHEQTHRRWRALSH